MGSGDPANVEGQAALLYWGSLGFLRNPDGGDRLNILLNYGYGLLRSVLAQALTACGWLPCFGLHHRGVYNAFNLADDLIEPWRPFVDLRAISLWQSSLGQEEFDKSDRRRMAGLLYARVNMNGEEHILLPALRLYAEQLLPCLQSRSGDLVFPTFSLLPEGKNQEPDAPDNSGEPA